VRQLERKALDVGAAGFERVERGQVWTPPWLGRVLEAPLLLELAPEATDRAVMTTDLPGQRPVGMPGSARSRARISIARASSSP